MNYPITAEPVVNHCVGILELGNVLHSILEIFHVRPPFKNVVEYI